MLHPGRHVDGHANCVIVQRHVKPHRSYEHHPGVDPYANLDSPPGGRKISIETALTRESEVEVSVADSGTGIPKEKLKDVFDTFYTTKQQGTGLGLSIARTIVETYGGRIWAENRVGGGAVFRFTLPTGGRDMRRRGDLHGNEPQLPRRRVHFERHRLPCCNGRLRRGGKLHGIEPDLPGRRGQTQHDDVPAIGRRLRRR